MDAPPRCRAGTDVLRHHVGWVGPRMADELCQERDGGRGHRSQQGGKLAESLSLRVFRSVSPRFSFIIPKIQLKTTKKKIKSDNSNHLTVDPDSGVIRCY